MTFGSLFAGIGGFDLGFERAGMRCVWQVERDRQCLELLASKWPGARRVDDVVRARYALERKYAGRMDTAGLIRPDVICGGFPCQDLSVAGKRRGLAGSRSGLFWTMRRVIAILKPTWFVLENVPGLLSSNKRRDMGTVVRALVDSGYGVAWRVLDSQFFGLAQRRKRVFFVGHLGDVRRAAAVLFDGESMSRDSPPSRRARESVAGTLEARVDGGGFPGSDGAMIGHVVATAYRTSGNCGVMEQGDESETFAIQERAVSENLANGPHGKGYQGDIAYTLEGRSTTQSVAFRLGVRRLMPIECERLQGFPDNWTAGFSDSARYRMLGNAVSVPVAEWIGRRIMRTEHGRD